jgi:sugar-specific transcriptional regulator TrmB
MYEDELQQIGLSEKEARVYVTALELGKATAQQIATKSHLKRPTTYFTIDVLMNKGLMSSIHEGKKQFFMAENPERLEDVFNARQDELKRQGEKLKTLIPELKKVRPETDGAAVVRYYTGREGALNMTKDLLADTGDEVWMVYPADVIEKLYTPQELESIRFVRQNKNVKIHALYTSAKNSYENDAVVTRKKLDITKNPVTADVAVYGNKVRLASFGDQIMGVVVENTEIAETIKTIFKLAWEGSDKHLDNPTDA